MTRKIIIFGLTKLPEIFWKMHVWIKKLLRKSLSTNASADETSPLIPFLKELVFPSMFLPELL